jgi:hypothetical protein
MSGTIYRVFQPFPMNPSFKPPIPLSDALRTILYQKYMEDPVKNSVRELARQHHLSMKRVDAILRLKGLEESWVKASVYLVLWWYSHLPYVMSEMPLSKTTLWLNPTPPELILVLRSVMFPITHTIFIQTKPLQTGFRVGMEKLLGVEANVKSQGNLDDFEREAPRQDVDAADLLDENEGDWARQKYRRMFWESIPEGDHVCRLLWFVTTSNWRSFFLEACHACLPAAS